ncbi:amino acid adenylation domain-containing protein [Undibacterium pigrum]|uniref:Amino acid adenylation domain-containing protein n=1 Tax=Undibacterium pigrum TaxID=401470 RepID=A0A318IZI8_9BURK|nr:amino acid adenylation domain-containing protein [Undibacterium pigrum]PXX40333.1 amino acid adenylation domain-containing protein [Undibacterium pigrum]
MKKTANLLISGFLNAARNHPNSNALWVDEQVYTYAELLLRVARISRTLGREIKNAHQQRCAVLVERSITAYASVLGSLLAGMSYVPLNAKFPAQRNLRMLELSSSTSIVVDERSMDAAKEILQAYPDPLMVLMPETDSLPTWAASASQHTYILKRQLAEADTANLALPQKANAVAYVLFTSGSTGLPKGVAVTNDNASTYVANIIERYQPGPGDRFTQFFDFTFDLSVHDIFVSLSSGACLYSVPGRVMMMPLKFVQQHELTHWFSVPSLAACLKRYNALRPGILPSLKYSLFCGEALPTSLAQDWQPAAPNSVIENLYGPTEATIAFTVYPYQADDQRIAALPVVPIGTPLPGQEVVILDEHFAPVADGETGELYLGGSQLAQGYWENTELTRQRFLNMRFEGKQASRWYRTGDLASHDAQAGLLYGGRIDNQVKIRGYRVEVQEVEAVIRRLGGSDLVAVVPWPLAADGSVQGLLAYGCGFTVSSMEILKACTLQLPAYMVPQDLIELRKMPFNSNGKIDYPALQKMAGDGDKLKREAVTQGL